MNNMELRKSGCNPPTSMETPEKEPQRASLTLAKGLMIRKESKIPGSLPRNISTLKGLHLFKSNKLPAS
ncbi:hypothetical protein KKD49_08710 [Myxococcota bacterium]|nr:hypothetical protein [Myxococcota bacterium]